MSLSLGHSAERDAKDYLLKQGLQAVTSNYRSKIGEVDLIMRDHDQLVFIEVRLRKDDDYGSPAETVTRHKQQKIIRTAKLYLQEQELYDRISCRFDVVAIDALQRIEWIRDAFQVR